MGCVISRGPVPMLSLDHKADGILRHDIDDLGNQERRIAAGILGRDGEDSHWVLRFRTTVYRGCEVGIVEPTTAGELGSDDGRGRTLMRSVEAEMVKWRAQSYLQDMLGKQYENGNKGTTVERWRWEKGGTIISNESDPRTVNESEEYATKDETTNLSCNGCKPTNEPLSSDPEPPFAYYVHMLPRQGIKENEWEGTEGYRAPLKPMLGVDT
ncbi:hypothetical protein BJ165DRAFT_1542622 [Panaeolus papilionaceus]|nr:hypothetical protein BJ165DRAFT_1542622 [Panaeolus papilionaceus]